MKLSTICLTCQDQFGDSMDGLSYLFETLKPFSVRIRYEMIPTGVRTENGKSIMKLGRVVLAGDMNRFNTYNLENEFASYVIDAKTWRIISVSTRACLPRPTNDKINRILKGDDYTLTKIVDGTVVNLYNHNGVWNLATTTAFDNTFKKWVGEESYAQVFYRVAGPAFREEVGMTLNQEGRLEFSNLDATSSYNFIIRDHRFNPFSLDKEGLTFVNQMCVDQDNFVTEELTCPFTSVAIQEVVDQKFKNVTELTNSLKSALPDGVSGKSFNYGYILHQNAAGEPSIMIRSALMERIKYHAYEFHPRIKEELNEMNREKYRVLKNVLHKQHYEEFLALFPQYKEQHKAIIDALKTIEDIIVKKMKNTNANLDQYPDHLVKLAKKIYESISTRENLSSIKYNQTSLITDLIYNNFYTALYLTL